MAEDERQDGTATIETSEQKASDLGDVAFDKLMEARKTYGENVPDSVIASIRKEISTNNHAQTTPSVPAKGGSEEVKAEPSGQVAPGNDAEYRQSLLLSRNALKRDGWSEERLASLDEATIIEVGGKRKAEQDKQAREWAKSKGRANPADGVRPHEPEAEGEPGEDGTTTEGEPGEPEALGDTLEELDDESKKVVKNALKAERQRATVAERRALGVIVQSVRQSLAEKFSNIGDDAAFQRVLERMDKIGGSSMRPADATPEVIRSMMEDAAWIEFGKATQQAARARHVSRVADLTNGQPDLRGHSGTAQSKPLTTEEREAIAFEAVQAHPGDTAAQRQYVRSRGA